MEGLKPHCGMHCGRSSRRMWSRKIESAGGNVILQIGWKRGRETACFALGIYLQLHMARRLNVVNGHNTVAGSGLDSTPKGPLWHESPRCSRAFEPRSVCQHRD